MLRATELKFIIYYDTRCNNTWIFRMDIMSDVYADIILYCLVCVHQLII